MLVSDGARLRLNGRLHRQVLILVLVDVGLGQAEVFRHCCGSPVLILVLVDVGLGRTGEAVAKEGLYVLILVLVDVGLGLDQWLNSIFQFTSLNPCFSGCWSRTVERDPWWRW